MRLSTTIWKRWPGRHRCQNKSSASLNRVTAGNVWAYIAIDSRLFGVISHFHCCKSIYTSLASTRLLFSIKFIVIINIFLFGSGVTFVSSVKEVSMLIIQNIGLF